MYAKDKYGKLHVDHYEHGGVPPSSPLVSNKCQECGVTWIGSPQALCSIHAEQENGERIVAHLKTSRQFLRELNDKLDANHG